MEDLELDVDVTLPIFIQLNVKRESEKDWLETSRWVKFQVRHKNIFFGEYLIEERNSTYNLAKI